MTSSVQCAGGCGLVLIALAIACGGSGDGTGGPLLADAGLTSGIDESTPLLGLTPAQATSLCEWVATRVGGYGRTIDCGSGDTISSDTYSQCLSGGMFVNVSPDCTATVSDVETCINGVVEQDPCTGFPFGCLNILVCAEP
jgi:hypothetical protein